MSTRWIAPLLTLTIGVAVVTAIGGGSASGGGRAEHRTERRTVQFLDALERTDWAAVAQLMDPGIRYTVTLNPTGSEEPASVLIGRDQVIAGLQEIHELLSTVRLADRRVSVADGGRTSFVQSTGDFLTADGRPYRNVYMFRLDWRDGRLVSWEEYNNPVTICITFDPDCQML